MNQVSPFLRRLEDGYSHWCPGCREVHVIFTDGKRNANWAFNQNLLKPTFAPSVKITGKQTVVDDRGEWTGEWVLGPDGNALPYCCHYFLTDGVLIFQNDCTHSLNGQKVPLPPLPVFLQDPKEPGQ